MKSPTELLLLCYFCPVTDGHWAVILICGVSGCFSPLTWLEHIVGEHIVIGTFYTSVLYTSIFIIF